MTEPIYEPEYFNEQYRESALHEIENGPFLVTGLMLQVMRRLFADTTQLQFDCNKGYVYREDVKASRITIVPDYDWDRKANVLPTLVIKRGDITRKKMGIGGDRVQGFEPLKAGEFLAELSGSASVWCVSTKPMVAEFLASEIGMFWYGFSPLLREEMHLSSLEMVRMGRPRRFKQDNKQWIAPVDLTFAYHAKWSIVPATGLLKGVIVATEFKD